MDMKKFKIIENGYIIAVTTNYGQIEITDGEYSELLVMIRSKPTAPDGYAYMLRADTLEWELVELPPVPEPEPTAEDILGTLFGGDAT